MSGWGKGVAGKVKFSSDSNLLSKKLLMRNVYKVNLTWSHPVIVHATGSTVGGGTWAIAAHDPFYKRSKECASMVTALQTVRTSFSEHPNC